MSQASQKRFTKLSLKKHKLKLDEATQKRNRSSDLIILDESFDRLRSNLTKNVRSPLKFCSPIVINDSSELSYDAELPSIKVTEKSPSRNGNVSFNGSQIETPTTEVRESRPSIGGWSPAQGILCATPKHLTVPTTPKDTANESHEHCSIKKIQQSQKKLLSDLYGEVWKSIPRLFKDAQSKKESNMSGVTKTLNFNDDDDSDKENNIRKHIRENKKLYLTGSDAKRKAQELSDIERKSKKKLYTEKIPNTPELVKTKVKVKRDVATTTKKAKITGKSVTEIVEIMKDQFPGGKVVKDQFPGGKIKEVIQSGDVCVTPRDHGMKRFTFMGSLADNVPNWRCNPEAFEYKDHYKTTREKLTRKLFVDFNRNVFGDQLDADMPVVWDTKLRSTAGTTTNRLIKQSNGDRIRTSSIKLSVKVLDAPQRLRDTLIHELCHAATWVIDHELRAGHGPLWKKWASRALKVYPELVEITRCHDLEIHFKYSYKCTKCGYTIKRHSKSLDITKKCCGYCRGTFQLILNKKTKDGVVVSTPARQGEVNEFAKFVKENYGSEKKGKSHAQVMKVLGEQFSAKKKKVGEVS